VSDSLADAADEDLALLAQDGWQVKAFTLTDHFAVARARARWSLLFEKCPGLLRTKPPAAIGIAIVQNGSERRYAAFLHLEDARILMETVETRECRLFVSRMNEEELYFCCCGKPPRFDLSPPQYRSCFISHSSKDLSFAHKLRDALVDRGVKAWLATRDSTPGSQVFAQLEEQIRKHERFVLCCSRAAKSSKWVITEVSLALSLARRKGEAIADRFVVLNLQAQEPRFSGPFQELQGHVFVDLSGWNAGVQFQRGLGELLKSLRIDKV